MEIIYTIYYRLRQLQRYFVLKQAIGKGNMEGTI